MRRLTGFPAPTKIGGGGNSRDVGCILPYHHTYHMVICMKTTLNIDDTVMRRLREEAARRQTTMSSLVEAGLRRVLADAGAEDGDVRPLPPLPTWKSGGHRVDVSNREELYGVMEGE